MIIKILGSGCKNCAKLEKNTEDALKTSGIEATIEKVTDFKDIANYGVMTTPGLVINDVVVSQGKVLKENEIVKLLEHHAS
ncbi:MAG: thioredoxin family protein [Clostridium sp.]|nr:thioredoxin family protein [Clostridium sp.]